MPQSRRARNAGPELGNCSAAARPQSRVNDHSCLSASWGIWERRTRVIDYKGHDGAVGEREVLQVAAARSVHGQRRRRRWRRRHACRRRREDFSAFTHSDIEEVQAARRDVEGLDTLHGTGAQNACSHLAHVAHCQYGALGCGEGGGSTGRVAAGSSLPNSKTRASGGTTSSFECKGGKLVKCCLYAGVQGQRPRPACASSGRAAQFSSCRHASPLRSSACALIGTGHLHYQYRLGRGHRKWRRAR